MTQSTVGAQQAAPHFGKTSNFVANAVWSAAACRRFYDVKNFAITRRAITSLTSTCSGRGPSRALLTFRQRTHQPQ